MYMESVKIFEECGMPMRQRACLLGMSVSYFSDILIVVTFRDI